MEYAIGICLGLGLAASSGFRVFVPLLVANIASLSGIVNLSPGFSGRARGLHLPSFSLQPLPKSALIISRGLITH